MVSSGSQPKWRDVEAVEGRAWRSLTGVTAAEPLFDSRGILAGQALFSDAKHPLLNRVISLGLDRPVEAGTLDCITQAFDAASTGTLFLPIPPTARPASLPRQLKERGFKPAMKEAKLCRATQNPPSQDPYYRIRQATPEDCESVREVYASSGMQQEWVQVVAANLGAPGWHHYLALEGGRPVALASMFVSEKYAWCLPGWSLPEFRHRGYQRALGVHRVHEAGQLGCEWVSTNVDVTEDPIGFTVRSYTRLGFELLYVRTTYVRHHPNVPLPDPYARRMLVPSS